MKTRPTPWLPLALALLTFNLSVFGAAPVGLLVNTNDTLANVTAQRLWSSNFAALATNPAAMSAGTLTLTNPLAVASGGTGVTNAAAALGALGGQPTNSNLTTVSSLTGGTSTNFLGGDGTFRQVTTNMVPGLNAALAAAEPLNAAKYQATNVNLTTVASLTGGTSTNFLAGDGAFKQPTTNMIPGLVALIAGLEPLNASKYQSTNSTLTSIASLSWTSGDLLIASNSVPARIAHPGANGKVLTTTNTPAGGLAWMDPPSSGGSGTVSSVGMASSVSGLQFTSVPITTSGTASLTGVVAIASGGTGQTNAAAALGALGGQPTNSVLTTIGALTSGTSTNFLAGDGSFKQVATNMIPGLVSALAASEPLNANKYQATNSNLTDLSSAGSTGTGAFVRATNSTMVITNLTALSATLSNATLNGTTTLVDSTNSGTMGVAGAVTIGTTNVALALSQKANTNAPTFIGTSTFAGITNVGTIGSTGAIITGTTNIALELSLKANTNAPTFLGTATFNSTTNTGTAGYAGAVTIGTTNVALELSKKANTNAPTFLGLATFASTTNSSTAGFASDVIVGTTNVAGALALKAPLTSAALVTPTLTNATYNGSMTMQMVERQPHATVTNYVADPTVSGYQIIYATNLVTKFLHLTNAAAGLQTTFLVIAGTNTTVSVELPSTIWACNTNKVSIAINQILPISIMCYGSNNTNVVASMGQPLIR